MKQNEDITTPDPREVLNDIAVREAQTVADNAAKTTADGKGDTGDTAASFLSIIKGQAEEGEKGNVSDLSLAKILGGDILNTKLLRQQIGVIIVVFLFIIVYISNRYSCQQNLIQIDKLNKELQDAKYRALSSTSELTEQCRESKVLEKLRESSDSTLHVSTQPPYIINVPTND